MDGHGSHVTLKAIKQIQEFGLNMITLFFHTSHALQPLNVSRFKPFKSTFFYKQNASMARSKLMNLTKLRLLDGWTKP
jgi:hypothetical protein